MFRIRESVDGASVAPATPSGRAPRSTCAALPENAAATDAAPNVTAPSISSRRRPIRSPSVPIVIRQPATRKP